MSTARTDYRRDASYASTLGYPTATTSNTGRRSRLYPLWLVNRSFCAEGSLSLLTSAPELRKTDLLDVLIAFFIFFPNLAWQLHRSLPTVKLLRTIRAGGVQYRLELDRLRFDPGN